MGDLVNLNKARKAAKRQDSADKATANRVKHGRSGAEKQNDRRAEERRQAALAGLRRDSEAAE